MVRELGWTGETADNWCLLSHDDPAAVMRAYAALLRGEFLAEFIPVPKAVTEAAQLSDDDTTPSHEQLNRFAKGNNARNDYREAHWGTRSEAHNIIAALSADGKSVTARFDTAWCPPFLVYGRLERQHGFRIKAFFAEASAPSAGAYGNGATRYFKVHGKSADQLVAMLPPDMDRLFRFSQTEREEEELRALEDAAAAAEDDEMDGDGSDEDASASDGE